jgi:hypothetical protein
MLFYVPEREKVLNALCIVITSIPVIGLAYTLYVHITHGKEYTNEHPIA